MELECTPMHHRFKLHNNRSYCIEKNNNNIYVRVVFPTPRMKINGKLIIDQSQIELNGEGYHDHLWGTTSLIYSIKKWHWGRIYTDKFTALFAEVFPSNNFSGKLKFLYYAKVGSMTPDLARELTITPYKWKRKFMWGFPFVFNSPRELSIKCSKMNLSFSTRFKEIIKLIKIYIRFKVVADFRDNEEKFTESGWVEYFKIPSSRILQKIFLFLLIKKYKSNNWRKKQKYEHLLPGD